VSLFYIWKRTVAGSKYSPKKINFEHLLQADEKQQLLAEAIEALPLYTPPQSDCKSASEIATRYLTTESRCAFLQVKITKQLKNSSVIRTDFFRIPTFHIIYQILHD
jgi:hypothetical protein